MSDALAVRSPGPAAAGAATLARVAFVSTMPPQRCGLASFTADLMAAVHRHAPEIACDRVPIHNADTPAPALGIAKHEPAHYARAGRRLLGSETDLVCIQHEFGIFGGPDGEMLLELLDAAGRLPIVVTLHTVLDRPSANQRRVMDALLERADRVVVMTQRSASVLRATHRLRAGQLHVIPHGIPDAGPLDRAACRSALGIDERPMLLTFGLLSPGKGIEHVIRALPALTRQWPDLLYVVMGATHPNLVRDHGEAYRHSLDGLARGLGVCGNLRFVDRFVDLPELLTALSAADIYVTPYNNEAQSVSGTLSYSYGLGTPVVSTPYHHAAELLADGRGMLVPFADPEAIAAAVSALLSDPARQEAMRSAAQLDGWRMRWSQVGRDYLRLFEQAAALSPAMER